MLFKLKMNGVSDLALKWFNSYLANRKQHLEVRGTEELGVPQGSIVGSLLFLIDFLIDFGDIFQVIRSGKVTMYADDTAPRVRGTSLKLLYMLLVQSQMGYSCDIWGNRLHMHTERITKLQKRAARLKV